MRLTYPLIVVSAILLLVGTSTAFDGNRTGFVLSGGLGFAPLADTDNNGDILL